MNNNEIERYNPSQRTNHWIVAILFVLAALSGLALFHPALFGLSGLFGGGTWTRILHPFIGVAMFVFFLWLAIRFAGHNRIEARDRQWLRQINDVVHNREEKLPEVGRYNAGQKVLFWVLILSMLVLLLSGIVIWREYFSSFFGIVSLRWASLLHAIGMPELVADSKEGYEALALKLAQDRPLRESLRTKLAANQKTHALFDTDRFCRNMEAIYISMWRRAELGQAHDQLSGD